MTYEQNVRAILESNFAESKDKIVDIAVRNIMALSENKGDLISRIEVESVLHNNLHALIDTDQLYQLYKDINRLTTYSAENKGEWIPVSERLPENDTEVVYQSERGGVGSCHYYNGFNNYPNTDPDCIFTDIVAWIPIPEPYKADMRGE